MRKIRKIDPIKASLFVVAIAIIVTLAIFLVFIPDIKKLKIAHMNRDKTAITMEQAHLENSTKKQALEKIKNENIKALAALQNRFFTDKFHSEIANYFSQIDMVEKDSVKTEGINTRIYTVKAELKDPARFYEFIDALNSSKNAVGVDFPIYIQADDKYNLTLKFEIVVHNSTGEE